jgi:hypothetical protein
VSAQAVCGRAVVVISSPSRFDVWLSTSYCLGITYAKAEESGRFPC